ncbi:MAG: Holliday junction branch migration protein RuvA [Mycobacterium leprae]
MFAFVRGLIFSAAADSVVIDVNGVGYRCMVPASTRSRLPSTGQEVLLHTSFQVREDSMTLYGFLTTEEYGLFELLLKVEGIGPKLAMAVLSSATPDSLRRSIALEDVNALVRIPGVGKKTAQRIVLELKEKVGSAIGGVGSLESSGPTPSLADLPHDPMGEALEALTALGYTRAEAAQALARGAREAGEEPKAELLVRLSLKHLYRG